MNKASPEPLTLTLAARDSNLLVLGSFSVLLLSEHLMQSSLKLHLRAGCESCTMANFLRIFSNFILSGHKLSSGRFVAAATGNEQQQRPTTDSDLQCGRQQ